MVLVVYFLPEGIVPAIRNWLHREPPPASATLATTEAAR
jgi:hypothetical protein